jgi:hypothetical protein
MSEVIAEFHDRDTLCDALRLAKERRGISFETLDALAGMSAGHSSKVLSLRGERRITFQTMSWLVGALGCTMQLVSDDAALARINGRMKPRDEKLARDGAVIIRLSRRWLSEIGRKGAMVRNAARRKEAECKAARDSQNAGDQ